MLSRHGVWGGRKQTPSKPKVFLQDTSQNGNSPRGGRKRRFSHFNCTSASESPPALKRGGGEGQPRPQIRRLPFLTARGAAPRGFNKPSALCLHAQPAHEEFPSSRLCLAPGTTSCPPEAVGLVYILLFQRAALPFTHNFVSVTPVRFPVGSLPTLHHSIPLQTSKDFLSCGEKQSWRYLCASCHHGKGWCRRYLHMAPSGTMKSAFPQPRPGRCEARLPITTGECENVMFSMVQTQATALSCAVHAKQHPESVSGPCMMQLLLLVKSLGMKG